MFITQMRGEFIDASHGQWSDNEANVLKKRVEITDKNLGGTCDCPRKTGNLSRPGVLKGTGQRNPRQLVRSGTGERFQPTPGPIRETGFRHGGVTLRGRTPNSPRKRDLKVKLFTLRRALVMQ